MDIGDDDVMIKTYKSMKLSRVEWLSSCEQTKSSKLAHDVLACHWDFFI